MSATGGGIGIKLITTRPCQKLKIVRVASSYKDSGAATGQRIGSITGLFQSSPGDLQHQALLRVHADGFTRGDTEKLRIKTIHIMEEAAPASSNFTRRIWVRVIISLAP